MCSINSVPDSHCEVPTSSRSKVNIHSENAEGCYTLIIDQYHWWETCSTCHNRKNGRRTLSLAFDSVSKLRNRYGFDAAFLKYSLGEVTFLKVLTTPIVVINSFRVADKLLAKRGAIYSGRPLSTMGVL